MTDACIMKSLANVNLSMYSHNHSSIHLFSVAVYPCAYLPSALCEHNKTTLGVFKYLSHIFQIIAEKRGEHKLLFCFVFFFYSMLMKARQRMIFW